MPEGKYFYIRSHLNGMSVDLTASNATPGESVTVYEHHGGPNQLWWEDKIHHCIRSKVNEDYVLTIRGEGYVLVDKWNPSNEEQKWVISGKHIHRLHDKNQVLDICGSSQQSGAKLCNWKWHGGPNQCWDFVHVEPRYCYFHSDLNNKVLSLENGGIAAGTRVVNHAKWQGRNEKQLWWEDKQGYIRSKANGFAIESRDGYMCCKPFEGKTSQRWLFIYGDQVIKNADNPNQCVDIRESNQADGASVIEYRFYNTKNQRWIRKYI